MERNAYISFITTIKERCRVCYTCVRECPAKAIRIVEGQAEVIAERCIGCGNCVRVCSQHAKKVRSSIDTVQQLLDSPARVAAIIAPSFPAEFDPLDWQRVVGMVRSLGFDYVHEVALGADLVSEAYKRLLVENPHKRYVSTSCPAIFGFIERYHPEVVPSLAPIVSPMVAMARVVRKLHGDDVKVVFLGPCIAKKAEAASLLIQGEVDAALTFVELREMLDSAGVSPQKVQSSDFDPPRAGMGALLAVNRGLLQAAGLQEDLLTGEVVAADGRNGFVEAIREFAKGDLEARLLEVLCCNGCIMGAGMSRQMPQFSARRSIANYVRQRQATLDQAEWQRTIDDLNDIDLERRFKVNDQRIPMPMVDEIAQILSRMGKFRPEDELNCGACGYDTCCEHATAIYRGLAESEMCLPYMIDQLRRTIQELAVSNEQLAGAQAALFQAEKLASMGQLAAGIAHEVNNPLGIVLMYAHLLLQEYEGQSELREDLSMIVDQADRCKKIVSGLLHFARQNKLVLQSTDIREMINHTLRAMRIGDNYEIRVEHQLETNLAELDRDQIIQVLTNLISNAQAAMPGGGTLAICTGGSEEEAKISVSDTGHGIARDNLSRIFEPFFTTKQIGMGTGLGLAVTYGIVKMHRGDINVESNVDPAAGPTGTTFTVTLPRAAKDE